MILFSVFVYDFLSLIYAANPNRAVVLLEGVKERYGFSMKADSAEAQSEKKYKRDSNKAVVESTTKSLEFDS